MQDGAEAHPAEPTARRMVACAVAVAAGVALVAVGSARSPAGGTGGGTGPAGDLAALALTFLLGALVVGFVAALAAGVYALWPEGPPRPPEASLRRLLATTLTFTAALLLTAYLGALLAEAIGFGIGGSSSGTPPTPTAPSAAGSGGGPARWLAGVLGALLAIGLLGALLVRERRVPPPPPAAAAPAVEILRRLVVDLPGARDPRGLVIAAYARMVHELGALGHPRSEHETPAEYLQRVLPAVGGGELAATRLRELYELARFSPHPISRELRDAADSALAALWAEIGEGERPWV